MSWLCHSLGAIAAQWSSVLNLCLDNLMLLTPLPSLCYTKIKTGVTFLILHMNYFYLLGTTRPAMYMIIYIPVRVLLFLAQVCVICIFIAA